MEVRMQYFRMLSSLAILCLVCYVCAKEVHEKDHGQLCRYWCRTIDHRYYCCPSGKADSWPEYIWYSFLNPWLWVNVVQSPPFDSSWPEIYMHEETTKHCPPLRTDCPRSYDWYLSIPTSCHDDDDCHKGEKCCYDVCLEHKTCKQAE